MSESRADGTSSTRKPVGERIVQIVLLVLIAYGLFTIGRVLTGSSSSQVASGGFPGGPPGGMGPGMAVASVETGSDVIAVQTDVATTGTVSEHIKLTGDVTTDASINLYPSAGGKVVETLVAIGDPVAEGQAVATIDPSQPGAKYNTSPVRATRAGTVTEVYVQVGGTVTTTSAIATVSELTDVVVVASVPERYIASIHTGLPAELSFVAYSDVMFAATVAAVSPVLDPTARTLEVKLVLDRPDSRVKVGMFATIRLATQSARNAVLVPRTAITSHYDEQVVYVLKDDGTVARRSVVTGISDGDIVQVSSGVTSGETVVSSGTSKLSDGATVRVLGSEQ